MSIQERVRITNLIIGANLDPGLAPRLADHLEVDDYGGLVRTLISVEANPDIIVNIAKEVENATQVVETLMADCVICVALEPKDPNTKDNIPGTTLVDPSTLDPAERKDIPKNYKVVFSRPIPPKGELHSEHLYFAGRCIGVAKNVDQELVNEVVNRLLLEFDLELHPPYRAVETFAAMGEIGIEPLINYIKDQTKDTFSREDAVLALGAIGNDTVVDSLGDWLKNIESRDSAMPLYALGRTNNKKAIALIEAWVKNNQGHEKIWVAQEALARLKKN